LLWKYFSTCTFERRATAELSLRKEKIMEIVENNRVPLGILLSEESPKVAICPQTPTTAWWTGGPDSQTPDADS